NNMNEIKSMIEKLERKTKSNKQLGVEGEDIFDDLVYQKYDNVEILDTSLERNNGDRILKFSDTKILFEIKNVSQSTLRARYKSYRKQILDDLILCKKRDDINIGILLSIDNTSFIGDQILNYEIIETENGKVCIIYCANIKNMPFLLYSCINLAISLSSFIVDLDNNDTEIVSILNTYLPMFNNMVESFKRDYRILEDLQRSNQENRCILQKFLDNITCLLNKNIKREMNETGILLREIFDIYKEVEDSERKISYSILQDECVKRNIPKHIIRSLGGIKKITSMYENFKKL
ncbi:MAG: hypothetical protein R3321_09380, partial [Nitrososphaeraceae archaeon]|nr:hypothetical protein [Nitrososphaeraceae archaeon]